MAGSAQTAANDFLDSLGLARLRIGSRQRYVERLSFAPDGPRNPREVWYLDSGFEATALEPRSSALAPSAYGEGFLPELMDSAGGMPGTASHTYSRHNGIDCAFILNSRNFVGSPKTEDDFVALLRSLLDQL